MAGADGIQKIRTVFEHSITAVDLHPSKDAQTWETAVLPGLQVGDIG